MKRLCLGLLALSQAWCGTDTGNPVNVPPSNGESSPPLPEDCLERPRDIAPDEPTPLGVTGAEVIALVQGEHRQTLSWGTGERNGGPDILFGPERGEADIVLTVEPSGGLRYIEREPRPDEEGVPPNLSVCEDVIEVDVGLGVASSGGALNEQVETRLRAMSADLAYGEVDLGRAPFGGTLTAESSVEGFVAASPASLLLDLVITRFGNRGGVFTRQEMVSSTDPERQLTYEQTFARFPADVACPIPVPLDASLRGASAEAAVASLNAASPGVVTTDDSLLTYSVATVGQPGCLSFHSITPSELTLEFPARLTLSAPQANIEGSLDVSLVATSRQGVLDSAHAGTYIDIVSRDPEELADVASQLAIHAPIDFSGHVGASFSIDAWAHSLGSGGSVRVLGRVPSCADPAEGIECQRFISNFGLNWYGEPPESDE